MWRKFNESQFNQATDTRQNF